MQAARTLRTLLLSLVAGAFAVGVARFGISALPIAWFVLAVNAAFIFRFAAARARAPRAAPALIELDPNLEALLQSASTEAGRRGHRQVTLEHLLFAMTHDTELAALLRACGADPDDLARELEEYLALLSPEPALDPLPLHHALERAARVTARAGRKHISAQSVLVQIRRDPDAYASLLLRAAGIELVDLLRCISHGKPDLRPQPLTGASRAALRLHNDDYTTMEFVVQVLRSFFGMNEDEAKQRMLQIHSEGSSVVATLPMEDALGRAVRIFDEAERAEFPLRCSLEAV